MLHRQKVAPVAESQTKTRDNDRRSQQCPCRRWNGPKIWFYASAHAAFLPDLLFADAFQYPKIGLQVEEQEVFVFSLS